jgi:hypothetical protein
MLEQLEGVSCVFFFVQIGHSQNYDIEVLAGNDSSVIEMVIKSLSLPINL